MQLTFGVWPRLPRLCGTASSVRFQITDQRDSGTGLHHARCEPQALKSINAAQPSPRHRSSRPRSARIPRRLPSLAAFIASDPELAVYRRFDRLATRNLLYLQSELLHLESKLDGFDEEDRKRDVGDDLRASARVWEVLARKGNEHDRERMELVLRSRQVLDEYYKLLHHHRSLLALEQPHTRVLNALKKWFGRFGKPTLFGPDENLFIDLKDLVALRPAQGQDRLSLLLRRFNYFFRQKRDVPDSWGGIKYFPEHRVTRSVKLISTVVSAALLAGSVVALYSTKLLGVKLGLICVFTVLFAAALVLLTNARQVEIFGASAA
ncbi:hypothetical protein GP486_007298 [Trichoglossum hirsutum]|uniref:DUF6594 domain-containing protein n=1 Tax=Trichoglossum hirsutum TaxID=265104 RepID=A0A9P8L2V2_9PEZI|nr:hypothetical protein GP486_007298 [Trichoglossum hirsutum]